MTENLRRPAYFDSLELFDSAWADLSGSSDYIVQPISRTLGIAVKETFKFDRKVNVHGWKIFPPAYTRKNVETYMYKMAEIFTCRKADLIVSGNTYPNAVLDGWSIEDSHTDGHISATLTFDISEQTQDNQFSKVSDKIKNYWGRQEATFVVKDYLTTQTKTFKFRQDVMATPILLPQVERGEDDEANKRYSGRSGLELECNGWCEYEESWGAREYLEAYVYNMLCGPLGRIGTLTIYENTYDNAFLQSVAMQDEGPVSWMHYTLNFLVSPQC